jgi:ribosome biogenesis protein Nip4
MKDFENFRQINHHEKEIISNSFLRISSRLLPFFKKNERFFYISINKQTSHNRYPQIYLISEELKSFLSILISYDNICSAGLYFGFIKRGKFYLSLEGAEFLYIQGLFPKSLRLYVNEKGEKSLLYGNNILKKMLIDESFDFKEKDFLIVCNKSNEIIAIGQSQVESEQIHNLKSTDLIAVNLSDKGTYLREKQ